MPSREEIETVITWTAADDKATVYSLVPRVWRMCERAGGVEIQRERGVRKGRKVARTYLVDPACIRIRPRPKLNAEQVERARERPLHLKKGTMRNDRLEPDAGETTLGLGGPS